MGKMAEKLYGDSPKLEREEGGKMAVKKKAPDKVDDSKAESEDEAGAGQPLPVTVSHSMERNDMHHTMEREHHMHDMGGHGDKKEMHSRHQKMMADLHKRHEKEAGGEGKKEESKKE